MKKIFTLIITLSILGNIQELSAQNYDDPQNIKVVVQKDAAYPGGEMKLYQYIFTNIKYSQEAKDNNVEGTVMTSFLVNPDSTVSNISILSGVGYGVDEEIKRLLGEMKFEPAIENSLPTKSNVMYSFPIRAY